MKWHFPIVFAYQLGLMDAETWRRHTDPQQFYSSEWSGTVQDRWERSQAIRPRRLPLRLPLWFVLAHVAMIHGERSLAISYLKSG